MMIGWTQRVRVVWIIGLAALVLGVSGCTLVRLGYGNADELAFRWLDGWLDFNDEQTPKVRAALVDLHQWHRRTQLPDYAQWLTRVGADATADTTPRDVCRYGDELSERLAVASDRILPAAAAIALTLSDAQLAHMNKRFEQGQKTMRDEYLKGDIKAREAAQVQRSVSRAEWLYGSVDAAQREVLAAAVSQSPFDVEQMLRERQTRQQELLELLKSARLAAKDSPQDAVARQLQARLKVWLQQGRQSPRAEYRAYQQKVRSFNCELYARVHNAAPLPTRLAARDRLKGWEGDAKAMVASAPQP